MNKIKAITKRNILLMITAAMLLFYFSSCARKVSFQTSSDVPVAEGAVKVTKGKNINYKIRISLYNPAEPARLQPSKNTYVVWMKTDNNNTMNIGQINSSTDNF